MERQEIYLTKDGYKELKEELEHLKTVKLRELSQEIGTAREHGDLSENAEYDAAKEAQELCMKRIRELESNLMRVRIIDDLDIPSDKVYIGANVTIKNMNTGEEVQRKLVSGLEADIDKSKISISSPIGKGLMRHEEGDEVEIDIPSGKVKYKIIKISR